MTERLNQLAHFLALRRNTSLLLVALVLALTGERLWLGFAPKYLQMLGAGIFVIGLFDALQTFLGAIYPYPGGWLTDHWGQRRSIGSAVSASVTLQSNEGLVSRGVQTIGEGFVVSEEQAKQWIRGDKNNRAFFDRS